MKFIVFGLGNYGTALATKLVSLNHEVIGVDNRIDLVEKWKNRITYTIACEAGSLEAVQALPLNDVDVVVNALGEGEGANIMLTAMLKQLQVKRIICRVISPHQKTVLQAMGIEEFIYPEADSAERMAYTLDLKDVTDAYKMTDDFLVLEVGLPERYFEKKIFEADFVDLDVQPITLIRYENEKSVFGSVHRVKKVLGILTPNTTMKKGDRLVLFGRAKKLEAFVED
jgi:trk system potassium uptake protein TrkA